MLHEIFIDALRFAHFTGFALGIGAGAFADWSVLRQLNDPLRAHDLAVIDRVHVLVVIALGLLWISGLGLLHARTGFDPALFSDKLIMKLIVVGILTLNALIITRVAMPILHGNANASYMQFPFEQKVLLSTISAVSLCSWISALTLGVFVPLKMASFELLLPMFTLVYGLGIFGALIVTVYLQILQERRFPAFRHFPPVARAD